VTLRFRPKGPGAVKLDYAAYSHAWPSGARPLPPLPDSAMSWDMYGATVVVGRRSVP
jgi:hypothetical protein